MSENFFLLSVLFLESCFCFMGAIYSPIAPKILKLFKVFFFFHYVLAHYSFFPAVFLWGRLV